MMGMRLGMDDGEGQWGCASSYGAQLKPAEPKSVPGQMVEIAYLQGF